MIRKLIKYELLATRRMIIPFQILMISITLMNAIFLRIEKDNGFSNRIIEIILTSTQAVVTIATFLFITYWTLRRFYKDIYSEQAYLTHTLPVKSWEHIVSKVTVAFLWWITTFIFWFASMIGLGIIIAPEDFREFCTTVITEWEKITQLIPMDIMGRYIVHILISIILSGIYFYIKAYCAIGFGQMMPSHKILSSIGFYIIFGIVENCLSMIAFWDALTETGEIEDSLTSMLQWISKVMLYGNIFSIFAIAIYFIILKYLMEKKLDI